MPCHALPPTKLRQRVVGIQRQRRSPLHRAVADEALFGELVVPALGLEGDRRSLPELLWFAFLHGKESDCKKDNDHNDGDG